MPQYKLLAYHFMVSVILLVIVQTFDIQRNYALMLLYSINSLLVFGLFLFREFKYFKGININMLLLLAYLMRMVYPSITKSINGIENGKVFLGYYYDISDSVFQTSIMMNLYYLITYFFLLRYVSRVNIEQCILPYLEKYNISLLCVIMYVIGSLFKITLSFLPNTVVPFMVSVIIGNFTTLAIILQMINASLLYSKKKERIFILIIILEILRTMFFGFMKTPVMMSICFYALYCILKAKYKKTSIINTKLILTLSFAIVFLIYIVYPFITIKRDVAQWDIAAGGVINASYSNMDILSEVLMGSQKNNKKDDYGSLASDRMDALSTNSFFVDYINKSKVYNYEFIKESIHEITPRFLNEKKHASRKGLMASSLFHTGSTANYSSELSNSYIGQTASAYMLGGIIMVIFLACINGYVLSKYYIYLAKHLNNLFALLFFVPLLMGSLNAFEEIHDGGLSRCVLYCIYMIFISITNKLSFFNLSLKK